MRKGTESICCDPGHVLAPEIMLYPRLRATNETGFAVPVMEPAGQMPLPLQPTGCVLCSPPFTGAGFAHGVAVPG